MVSSHFYPNFGLCQCQKHCQDFREERVEGRNDAMGSESSDEDIPEEIVDFASDGSEGVCVDLGPQRSSSSPPYKSHKYLMSKFEGVDTDSEVEEASLDAARKRRVKSAVSRSAQKRSKVTATKPFKMTLRYKDSWSNWILHLK